MDTNVKGVVLPDPEAAAAARGRRHRRGSGAGDQHRLDRRHPHPVVRHGVLRAVEGRGAHAHQPARRQAGEAQHHRQRHRPRPVPDLDAEHRRRAGGDVEGTDWDASAGPYPRGRIGTPEDIAGLAIFLAREPAPSPSARSSPATAGSSSPDAGQTWPSPGERRTELRAAGGSCSARHRPRRARRRASCRRTRRSGPGSGRSRWHRLAVVTSVHAWRLYVQFPGSSSWARRHHGTAASWPTVVAQVLAELEARRGLGLVRRRAGGSGRRPRRATARTASRRRARPSRRSRRGTPRRRRGSP